MAKENLGGCVVGDDDGGGGSSGGGGGGGVTTCTSYGHSKRASSGASVFYFSLSARPPAPSEGRGPKNKKQKQKVPQPPHSAPECPRGPSDLPRPPGTSPYQPLGVGVALNTSLVAVIAPVIATSAITAITALPAGKHWNNSTSNSRSAIPETLGGSRAITIGKGLLFLAVAQFESFCGGGQTQVNAPPLRAARP